MRTQILEIDTLSAPNRIVVSGNKVEIYCDFCMMRGFVCVNQCQKRVKEIIESNINVGENEETEYLIRQHDASHRSITYK